jgi:hypothetical protein
LAKWLLEQGIGEDRAVLLDSDGIAAAKVEWDEGLRAGLVEDAVLVARSRGSSRGTARFANGQEALVDRLPTQAVEGAPIRLEVIRPPLAELGRLKRAQARPTQSPARPAPTLAERLDAEGQVVQVVRRFPARWDDLLAEAFAGEVSFPGGTLTFSPTPAMLLIDVDGTLTPSALALAAVPALAAALRRFDIGGSIGIDFPTLAAKEDRRTVDLALAEHLADWPHERTAMNGFGFVQLVARLDRPSLLQRATHDPAGTAARWLLRRAEALEGPGALLLRSHPRVDSRLRPAWLEALTRRSGREVRRESDSTLALEAPQAQLVAR